MKEKMYTVATKVSEAVHRDLKVLCAEKRTTISDLLLTKVFEEVAPYRAIQKKRIAEEYQKLAQRRG